MKIRTFTFNPLWVNTYLVFDEQSKQAIIIDPGISNDEEFLKLDHYIQENDLTLKYQLLTHGHFDHIWGVKKLKEMYNLPVLANNRDLFLMSDAPSFSQMFGYKAPAIEQIDQNIDQDDIISFGTEKLKVIAVPGHSPGHLAFYSQQHNLVFDGDVLFRDSIGRTDLPGGDLDQLMDSIWHKIIPLGDDTVIFPGHGMPSTIFQETKNNPFLQKF
jgi:glyoxylase-like metal-dependent hydrolase (beta-lactamase superfamily II)